MNSLNVVMIAAVFGWLGGAGESGGGSVPSGASAPPAFVWRHAPFVVGAPGRLDAAGDRRHPRRVRRVDSAVHAYADVEEVVDGAWLAHEVEHYARRAIDCSGFERAWCRREVRSIMGSSVIFLVAGIQAEIVWPATGNRAVRLGWRRIVATPRGTLTLEAPPADFAAALLREFPSQLDDVALDVRRDAEWSAAEAERLRYYAEQVLAVVADVDLELHRRHAMRFVEENLARIAVLRGVAGGADERAQSVTEEPWCSARIALPAIAAP